MMIIASRTNRITQTWDALDGEIGVTVNASSASQDQIRIDENPRCVEQ